MLRGVGLGRGEARLSRLAERCCTLTTELVLGRVTGSARRAKGGKWRGTLTADDMTKQVIARVQADGTCWTGGATWFDQQVMRVSVSNWSTTEDDIDRSADAIARCYRAV